MGLTKFYKVINYFILKDYLISRFYGFILSPFFKKSGRNIRINTPLKITGLNNISIGDNVTIGYKSWISASTDFNKNCNILIADGSIIGNFAHIYGIDSIVIGENVLIADKVYISDSNHKYLDINIPIINQGIIKTSNVVIGSGSWIGENVCIMGASIGKNSVIASNSVVTKNIPDYCIAAGTPARIIKRYNLETRIWE